MRAGILQLAGPGGSPACVIREDKREGALVQGSGCHRLRAIFNQVLCAEPGTVAVASAGQLEHLSAWMELAGQTFVRQVWQVALLDPQGYSRFVGAAHQATAGRAAFKLSVN